MRYVLDHPEDNPSNHWYEMCVLASSEGGVEYWSRGDKREVIFTVHFQRSHIVQVKRSTTLQRRIASGLNHTSQTIFWTLNHTDLPFTRIAWHPPIPSTMAPHKIEDFLNQDSDIVPELVDSAHHLAGASQSSSGHENTLPAVGLDYDPIAIIGMGCRLPGEVKSPSNLWDLLLAMKSGHSLIPAARWNIDAFYHPNGNEKIGTMSMNSGYFIHEDLRDFENSFFGINNIEATFMDPQQRKLLEVVYECLESAGVPLEQINGANIGTYVGSFTLDYWMMQTREPDYLHRYHATGMGTTILANRISHALNLQGPSFTLDTGCSASLYALHQACTALDAGECDAAIVAASNLLQSPEQQLGTMKAGVLSPTGICHTFDETADGYGRADGLGALYIKKLSKAIADGDPIRSIIRGTAVNSNGKTPGISLPSQDGQEAVIRKAYAKAGLTNFNDTQYVECHGTGTPVGDPIEVEALSRVFKRDIAAEGPLLIGSVKTNLGHSGAASGLSSIIKATLALEKGCIPATIGVKNLNPKIKVDEWGVQIVQEATEWPSPTCVGPPIRRISVNSFGYGGANSHAILDSSQTHAPSMENTTSEELLHARNKFLVPLSASTSSALEIQATRLVSMNLNHVNVIDLAHTLGTRRSKLAQRGFAIVAQATLKNDLQPEYLQKMGGGTYSKLPIAFVFTGQGAQWPQMGKELLEEFPSFRRSIQDLDNVLADLPERPFWTIQQALLDPKKTSEINHVTRSQPVCTAVQIALVQLLARWGIQPQSVIGHSSGEICAAYAAGRLSAAQAIVVAFYRGYVVGKSKSKTPGAMMAVSLGENTAKTEINALGLAGNIKVACVNSPESVTISGDEEGIDNWLEKLTLRGVFARKLNTNGRAYHSHHMATLGQEYQDLLEKRVGPLPLPERSAGVTWISSVHEQPVTGKILPSYWRKNLEAPVRFSGALQRLIKETSLHLVELGPHSALEMPIKQICKKLKLSDDKFHYSSALSRGKHGVDCAPGLMGNLFLHGHDVSFAKINYVELPFATGNQGKVLTDLPPYPWTYDQILFNESRSSRELRNRQYGHHDLLGLQALCGDGLTTIWRNTLRAKDVPWVSSHKLGNDVVFPGAGYIAMAIEGICQITGKKKADEPSFLLRHINIVKALPLSVEENDPGIEVFTTFRPKKLTGVTNSTKWYDFEVGSFDNDKSTIHATGTISLETIDSISAKLASEQADLQPSATRNWYNKFTQVGLNFGPDFQSMDEIETDRKREAWHARSKVKYLNGGGVGHATQADYIMHPITIDAMFQTALIASSAGTISNLVCMVPTAIETARFKAPASTEGPWFIDAISEPVGPGSIQIAAEVHNGQGLVCAQLENVSAVAFQGVTEDQSSIDGRHPMMRVLWKPDIAKLTQKNAEGYSKYLATAIDKASMCNLNQNQIKLATMAGLITHRRPRVNILELGNPIPDFTKHLMQDVLRSETPYRRYGSYTRGYFTANGELFVEALESVKSVTDNFENIQQQIGVTYDLIIFPNSFYAEEFVPERLHLVRSFLKPEGAVLGRLPAVLEVPEMASSIGLRTIQISTGDASEGLLFAKRLGNKEVEPENKSRQLMVIERGDYSAFKTFMVQALSAHFGRPVERVALSALTPGQITPGMIIVCTIELHEPFLATMSVAEMASLKILTDNAEKLLWITGGDQLGGTRPNFAMVSGFQRSLILEQPSLKFYTFDVDQPETHQQATVDNIIAVLDELHSEEIPDCETVQKNGVAYVSRFVPEETLNETFRQKLGVRQALKRLDQARPCRLTIKDLGQFGTLAFKQEVSSWTGLQPGFVEVEVKSVGLNAKDVFVYSGKLDSRGATSSLECAGIVTRVGSDVSTLKAGDRVVAMAPGHFATLEAFPAWACAKLHDEEDYNAVSTLPLVFATALYALSDRANLRQHESVLIHSFWRWRRGNRCNPNCAALRRRDLHDSQHGGKKRFLGQYFRYQKGEYIQVSRFFIPTRYSCCN
jgi:acyl transferase domain-containing protein